MIPERQRQTERRGNEATTAEMTARFRKYANAPYAILISQNKRLNSSMAVASRRLRSV